MDTLFESRTVNERDFGEFFPGQLAHLDASSGKGVSKIHAPCGEKQSLPAVDAVVERITIITNKGMAHTVEVPPDLVGAPGEKVDLHKGNVTCSGNSSVLDTLDTTVCRLTGNRQPNVHACWKYSVHERDIALVDAALLESDVHGRDGFRVLTENHPATRAEIQAVAGLRSRLGELLDQETKRGVGIPRSQHTMGLPSNQQVIVLKSNVHRINHDRQTERSFHGT